MNKKISTSLVASLLLATNIYADQAIQLDEITVTSATKSAQSIKDVTSNVDVITSEEIEERNFTTVSEALNTLAGINVISNGGLGTSSSLKLRGFDSKRVLVLIDGIRYNDVTSTSGAPWQHLMINDIVQIEIIKGAQSGLWGADASAGVINIITNKAKNGFSGSVNTEVGSFKTKKFGTKLSYGGDNYYVKGSVQSLKSDSFSAQAPNGIKLDTLEDDSYENLTANVKFGYNFNDSNKLDLSHTLIDARSEYDGCGNSLWNSTYSYYACTDSDIDKANNDSYYSKTKDTFSSINFNHVNSFAKIDVYGNSSIFNREFNDTQSYTGGINDGSTLSSKSEFDGNVKEYGLKSTIPYLNKESFVVVGADYKEFEHKNDISNEYKNKAIFITNSTKFDNTIFTQSLRYDKFDKFDNKYTGKLGLKQFFTNNLSTSLNYGTSYNVPTLFNLYSRYGNENINPEKTKSFDINVEYKNLKLTYFNNKIDNLIDYDSSISKYGNIQGESSLKGYEISYKQNLGEDVLVSGNYTHLSAQDSDGEDLARRAKRQLGFAVDYYGIDKLHLNVNGSYIGTRYNKANKDGEQTGKYTLWNSVVNYEINKTFSTYLKVDNLFNKYYQTVDGYATAERSAYIGLKATF